VTVDDHGVLKPLVGHVGHRGVRSHRARLATAPVARAAARVAGGDENRDHAAPRSDVVADRGVDEEQVVVLMRDDVEGAGTGRRGGGDGAARLGGRREDQPGNDHAGGEQTAADGANRTSNGAHAVVPPCIFSVRA
jgi:hypothetical protein